MVAVIGFHLTQLSETLLFVLSFLLLVSIIQLSLHSFPTVTKFIPESGIVILLACLFGSILIALGVPPRDSITFSPDLFFLVLIPPIIFEAGYSLEKGPFLRNIRLILLYAVVGTLLSTILLGILFWAVSPLYREENNVSFLEALVFGSVLSAVDPVAVLAVFESVKVNRRLHMLVFGESVLNDAISIVLFSIFSSLLSEGSISVALPFLAIIKFFIVSIGGIILGTAFSLLATYITKYSQAITQLQPLIIIICGLLSYTVAEVFRTSGIVAVLVYGMLTSYYTTINISVRSRTTLVQFSKLASNTAESIVFALLGISAVYHLFGSEDDSDDADSQVTSLSISNLNNSSSSDSLDPDRFERRWDAVMIIFTLFFITVVRFGLVFLLTFLAEKLGEKKVSWREKFIISYSGLRGAVAFALVSVIPGDIVEPKEVLITTMLVVIFFTIFVQGGTLAHLLKLFNVPTCEHASQSEVLLQSSVDLVADSINALGGSYVRNTVVSWEYVSTADMWIQKHFLRPPSPGFDSNPASEKSYSIAAEMDHVQHHSEEHEEKWRAEDGFFNLFRRRFRKSEYGVEDSSDSYLSEPFLASER